MNEFPLTCFDGGISELHKAHRGFQLADETKFDIIKANDNYNDDDDDDNNNNLISELSAIYQIAAILHTA